MKMQALILCGGMGTRLKSVVDDRPKSMALIRGKPFLQVLVEDLKAKGVSEFVLATGYMSEHIESHFGDGAAWNVSVAYSRERSPLGTGGAIKLAESLLRDRFLVLNGDTYVEFDPEAMRKALDSQGAVMAMLLKRIEDTSRYGAVVLGEGGRIRAFSEKGANTGPGFINAGVYMARKELLAEIAADRPVSLENEVMPRLLKLGVQGVEMNGLFIDIGVPEDYLRAQTLIGGGKHDR